MKTTVAKQKSGTYLVYEQMRIYCQAHTVLCLFISTPIYLLPTKKLYEMGLLKGICSIPWSNCQEVV